MELDHEGSRTRPSARVKGDGRAHLRGNAPPPAARGSERGRLAVVSYYALEPFEARGIRTRALVDALAASWEIELIAAAPTPERRGPLRRLGDRSRYLASKSLALDNVELWSRWRFGRWQPTCDFALLVAKPMSTAIEASSKLLARGIPYVLDLSDPWALTGALQAIAPSARRRAQAAERRLLEGAEAAILTTDRQAAALQALFPRLEVLVRPNGYVPAPVGRMPAAGAPDELRLTHVGHLYGARVDVAPFFRRLLESGRWRSIVLDQYGSDRNATLPRLPREIEVRDHRAVSWEEILADPPESDALLVIGMRHPAALPAKVVNYLSLPLPRIAFVDDPREDAISDYVRDKPGWLVVGDEPGLGARLADHLAHRWTAAELAPPASESWENVTATVVAFLNAHAERCGVLSSERRGTLAAKVRS